MKKDDSIEYGAKNRFYFKRHNAKELDVLKEVFLGTGQKHLQNQMFFDPSPKTPIKYKEESNDIRYNIRRNKKANTIVILTHESPDGDAIGSSLAMEKALRDMGKEPDVIIKEYPRIFNFLPNANKVKRKTDVEKYDLAISLDCADLKD